MSLRFFISMFFIVGLLQAQESHGYIVRLAPKTERSALIHKSISQQQLVKNQGKENSFFSSFLEVTTSDERLLDSLKQEGVLLYWEANRAQQLHYIPSDVSYEEQWYLDKIKAPEAWNLAQGDSTYIVAIVDSGVDYYHEDLKDNLAYNLEDTINGIDDDNDGYVDNYYGWDFGTNDSDPIVDGGSFAAHGSTMCGIAAASTDNGIGTASVAFNCKYLPVKITNTSGAIVNSNAGIAYAALKGAKVINCSFGSFEYSQAEEDIINYVIDSLDVMVVASAGNENWNVDVYPAVLENVIGVCALDENDQKIPISNYGANYDISAPGNSIYGPFINNQYSYKSGTSVAAAIVSSSAILLRSHFPDENVKQITNRILESTEKIEFVNENYTGLLGTGRLNLLSALEYEPSIESKLSLYPNPTNGVFFIEFNNLDMGKYELSVFDVLGKLYHREEFLVDENLTKQKISLQNINHGYYTIQLVGAYMKHSSGIVIVK